MKLLCFLAANQGQVVSRQLLLDEVWRDQVVGDDVLNVAISGLRKALDDDSRQPHFIQTIPRKGYKLLVETGSVPAIPEAKEPPVKRPGLLWFASAFSLLVVALAWTLWPGKTESAQTRLAILPFTLIGADKADQYLAEGITQSLIDSVAADSPLSLISLNSVKAVDQQVQSLADIGTQLDVDWIVQGNVQVEKEQMNISAKLMKPGSQSISWQTSLQTSRDQLFSAQRKLAQQIAGQFGGKEIKASGAMSEQTYQGVLQGNYYLNRSELEDAENAFLNVLVSNENTAAAYSGLAQVYFLRAYRAAERTRDYLAVAARYARQAYALAPGDEDSLLNMALTAFYVDKDYTRADALFAQAYAQNLHDIMLMEWYHNYLLATAKFEKAAQVNRQMRLASPLVFNKTAYYDTLYYQQDFAGALSEIEAISPYLNSQRWVQGASAWVYLAQRDWQRFADLVPPMLRGYGIDNQGIEAFLQRLQQQGIASAIGYFIELTEDRLDNYSKAELWASVGEEQKALEALTPLVENQELRVFRVKVEPTLALLQGTAAFEALIAPLNLPAVGKR
ncbi:winged helix-turn-helix domain-containing protein [Aliiglaciecola sp. CAU 1673]|uniref:winged helix-turn-helix domain-containing protein n=1 Tax=Aliiglaciecola sp. CAU 1673 TaxID=3032595 RepID=UPI0023D9A22C|nr:winged helix-turn-helix domain-containing protein [Aliiglaciecola sp. CAU 1673]MDF2176639.1 winged helix-turn-helix domain-containing protein [Aliiglaciecola sp. CAU 1673]